jgi:prolipoprotein diacylglyceryltransferase
MSFAAFLIIGTTIGLLDVYRQAGLIPRERLSRVDDAIILLLLSLVGARLDFILHRWVYFSLHLSEIPRFWLGGLDWAGAVAGGLAAIGLIGFFHRGYPHSLIADTLLPLLCPLVVACWLGAWTQNQGNGLPVPPEAWYAFPILDSTGNIVTRFPLQPAMAILMTAVSALGQHFSNRFLVPGRKFSFGFTGFSLVMLVSTFLCGDPSPYWLGLRADSWFAAAFTLIGLAVLIGTWFRQTNSRVPQTSNTI